MYEVTSELYKNIIAPAEPIFYNDTFMMDLMGQNFMVDFKYVKSKLKIDYEKDNNKENDKYNINTLLPIFNEYSVVTRKLRVYVTRSIGRQLNPYKKFAYGKCYCKNIDLINNYNDSVINLNVYYFSGEEISDIAKNQQLAELKIIGNKYSIGTSLTNTYFDDFLTIDNKKSQNTIHQFMWFEPIYRTYKNVSIGNILIEQLIHFCKNISKNDSLILFIYMHVNILLIFDIINLVSEYFEYVKITNYKYTPGFMINILFINKKNDTNNLNIQLSKNVQRLYDTDIIAPYLEFLNKISEQYITRLKIHIGVAKMKLDDNPTYKLIENKIKSYQFMLNELYLLHNTV